MEGIGHLHSTYPYGGKDNLIPICWFQEENDSLLNQLEATKNEIRLVKADLRSEIEQKDQQLKVLRQVR